MPDELKSTFVQAVLDHVVNDPYPSSTMMDLIEQYLDDPELRAEYVSMLVDKIANDRFPSMALLRRIGALVA